MKKLLTVLLVVLFMGCNLQTESEFARMPTYKKTLIYNDGETKIFKVDEFDGYENKTYYIDQNGEIINIKIEVVYDKR